MNKPVYLSQAILDISKTFMYESWYDYIKPKYKEKSQLCYMDTDSFIIHIYTETFCNDIAKDVKNGLIYLVTIRMTIDHYQQE